MGRILQGVLITCVVVLGYYLNQPVPPDVPEQWTFRIMSAVTAVITDVVSLCSKFGNEPPEKILQSLTYYLNKFHADDPSIKISEVTMGGVPVRVYQPTRVQDGPLPTLIYVHGGGFVFGSAKDYDVLCHKLVKQFGLQIFSVDYRLAPDHPSPAPYEDTSAVVDYIFDNIEQLQIIPDKIVIAGDSAGGNLAAAMSQRLRNLNKPNFAAQVLIYPWLQAIDLALPSYEQNDKTTFFPVNKHGMARFIVLFLNESKAHIPDVIVNQHVCEDTRKQASDVIHWSLIPKQYVTQEFSPVAVKGNCNLHLANRMRGKLLDPNNFPGMEKDLSNLPQTWIYTENSDTLRDEGIIYAERMRSAGNDVVHFEGKLGYHTVINDPDNFIGGQQAYGNMAKFIDKIIN